MPRILGLAWLALAIEAPPPAKTDNLQGTWKVKELLTNGDPMPPEARRELRVTISETEMAFASGDLTIRFKCKLDATKRPKTIDVTVPDAAVKVQRCKGIYQLSGDTLKLCLPNQPELERPTKFESTKGSGLGLMSLERVKK